MNGSGFLDRRSSVRLDMEKQLVAISWIDDNGTTVSRDVMCIDVSNGGLQIELERPLTIGITVIVVFNPNEKNFQSHETKVLRSVQQEHGWFNIGLQFIKG